MIRRVVPFALPPVLCCFFSVLSVANVFAGETTSPDVQEVKPTSTTFDVYVGTYTRGDSQGIYRLRFDPKTGTLTEQDATSGVKNPSFLALHPTKDVLYTVSEISDENGRRTGGVIAYKIDPESGALTKINQQASGGAGPCHVDVHPSGKVVAVANYGGGSVASFPVNEDGGLGEAASFLQHAGSSVNEKRQKGPHAHCSNFSPDGKILAVADLGIDAVMIYKVNAENGTLTLHDRTQVAPGSGPRHFAFHPTGKYAYVINELSSTVTAFRYDDEKNTLRDIGTVSTLPPEFKENNTTAEVFISPDGKFLFGSNRGHDSIAVFKIDQQTGRLTFVEHEPTGGKTPRNFNIDPAGNFILACNQATNSIVVLKVDRETGMLTPTGTKLDIPSPVCVVFRPVESP